MGTLDPIIGPILLGTIFNVLFYGIMVMQSLIYFQRFKQDRLRMKLVVGVLLVLDSVTCAFDIAMTYGYLVTNFGNFPALEVLNIALRPYPVTTAITAFIVQCFFGWRIQVLTGNKILSILVYSLTTVQLLAGIGTTIGGSIVQEFALFIRVEVISLVWLIGSLVTDIIITCSLVWHLRSSRTGFSTTDDAITRLIRITVQTGLATTTIAISVIIAFFAGKNTLIHIGLGVPLSKIYTNSLVSTLNSRQGWLSAGSSTDDRFIAAKRSGAATSSATMRDETRVDLSQAHAKESVISMNDPCAKKATDALGQLKGSRADLEMQRLDSRNRLEAWDQVKPGSL